MRPLSQLLTGKLRDVQCNDGAVAAFDGAREALARVTMLVDPRAYATTAPTVDASDSAVGDVLEQLSASLVASRLSQSPA